MNTVYFIRHGATAGNLQRRYIGRTDESLCETGREQILALQPPQPDLLFVSPMLRTRQSAELLFPDLTMNLVADLRETDFGIFEAKTADELATCADYRQWVDNNCETAIPEGETVEAFKTRCVRAFLEVMKTAAEVQTVAFVIHGGCIMAILEALAVPKRGFYEYHIGNGKMIRAVFDGTTIRI